MSNVLIGIIGVILFIGLALAGALILGDDFKSASVSTQAANYMTKLDQVSYAAQMFQMKTGEKIGSSRDGTGVGWLRPRFLKSVPSDPGYQPPQTYAYYTGTILYMQLAWDNAKAKDICEEVQRTAGQIGPSDPMLPLVDIETAGTKWQRGCVSGSANSYTIYSKL